MLDKFQMNFPAIELPSDNRKLARLVGCTPRAIRDALGTREKQLARWIEALSEPLQHRYLLLLAETGERVPTTSLESYTWKTDPLRHRISLDAITVCGEHYEIPIRDRWQFLNDWRQARRVGQED